MSSQNGDTDPKKYPVMELFGPTIQGEGIIAGRRSHFIRFGGCPFRCKWCDSMHAVDPERVKANAKWLTAEQIHDATGELSPSTWVTLTGGDPVMWDLMDLVELLNWEHTIAVETEGVLYRDWLLHCSLITISPKGPSSGMLDKLDHGMLEGHYTALIPLVDHVVMKIVVFDEQDFDFARMMFARYPKFVPYLSVGTPLGDPINFTRLSISQRMQWLYERVLQHNDLRHVVVLPQLHVLAWGSEKGV